MKTHIKIKEITHEMYTRYPLERLISDILLDYDSNIRTIKVILQEDTVHLKIRTNLEVVNESWYTDTIAKLLVDSIGNLQGYKRIACEFAVFGFKCNI